MAFLFKGRKAQQQQQQHNNAPSPNQLKESPPGAPTFSSAIPAPNAPIVVGRERNQTPTPSSSVNNSLNSLAEGQTPSPEQKGLREKPDSEAQGPRRAPGPFPPNNANALLYPWSQRRLNFTTAHPSPFPRYGAAVNSVASKDGEIYLMGGLINGATVKGDLWMTEADVTSLACYPIASKSEGPGPRVGHAALIVGNAFICFGGDTKMDDRDVLDDTLYLLNTSTRQWSRAVPAGPRPSGRYGHTLNIIGSRLFIFGGQVEGFFFNDLVAFDLNALQSPGNRWEVLIPNSGEGPPTGRVPPARTNHTVVSWNDKLFLFGGTNGIQWFNDVWAYDPRPNAWTQLDCIGFIPAPREGHAAAIVGDVMYIFGGRTEDANDLGDLAAFRISSRRWYTFQNMGPSPSPRSGHSMTSYGKQIVVLGGAPSSTPRDAQELSLVYLLDTEKIRYPVDPPPPAAGENRIAGARRPSGGEKSGIPQSRGPQVRDLNSAETKDPKRPAGAPRESIAGGPNNFSRGPEQGPTGAPINAGSRLPRASMSHAPSGPPPQQQAPPPRANGVLSGIPPGARAKTPTRAERGFGPPVDTKLATGDKDSGSPITRDSPSAPSAAVNGRRTPTQQGKPPMKPKEAGDSSISGNPVRTRSRQARQQGSVDSTNEGPNAEATRGGSVERARRGTHSRNQSLEPEGLTLSQQQHESLVRELEELRGKNAWYASEMALARKAGYSSNMTKSSPVEEQSSDMLEDDKPLVETLLLMRNEIVKLQTNMQEQAVQAAQQVAEVEKQRDIAVSEAVYAKTKFAAHGGSQAGTPQPDSGSRETFEMDGDRSTDLNRKLAVALKVQTDLQSKLAALNRDIENERQSRQLSEETSQAAQSRVSELDTYRQQSSSEVDRLKDELHQVQKQAREEAARYSESSSTSKMLQADNEDLKQRLEDALTEARNHSGSIGPLREAVVASTSKTQLLEKKLEEERDHRENLDRKMRQLRAEHEERTAELDTTTRKLKDAEELAESHAAEARSHREVMLSGLEKISAKDLDTKTNEIDPRVVILQGQVQTANTLVRDSQAAADVASEKLRRAEERIAGLEAYQEQASREGLTMRKQLQQAMREAQTLQEESTETKQRLEKHQLESTAMAVQHGALKDLLTERGISPSDARARSNHSPGSGLGGSDPARVRELELQLESSMHAHRETQSSWEAREQEADRAYREKLEQLEVDYQSAVHYVKGTEKMLKRMKDELAKYKTQNARLQADLEESQQQHPENRSLDTEAPTGWEQERQKLHLEIESLQASVKDGVTRLESQMADVRAELQATQAERDQYRDATSHAEQQYASVIHQTRTDLDQLQRENNLLEARASDAEGKVTYLLSQVESSVDNYRRQSRQIDPSAVNGIMPPVPSGPSGHNRNSSAVSAESSIYGPDNRNSVALDSLASELDLLRSQWENTNKNYRLSNTFDFEKPSASTGAEGSGDLSGSLASWRKKLDFDEAAGGAGNSGLEGDGKRLSKTTSNDSTPTRGNFGTGAGAGDDQRPNVV
ncbi:MAG: hypothetical protein M4579_001734 [Chaenotheca gracillima]|nr:MAG: hypothetical protein M4579_001734 [Chaenotheca gracillima]